MSGDVNPIPTYYCAYKCYLWICPDTQITKWYEIHLSFSSRYFCIKKEHVHWATLKSLPFKASKKPLHLVWGKAVIVLGQSQLCVWNSNQPRWEGCPPRSTSIWIRICIDWWTMTLNAWTLSKNTMCDRILSLAGGQELMYAGSWYVSNKKFKYFPDFPTNVSKPKVLIWMLAWVGLYRNCLFHVAVKCTLTQKCAKQ